MARCRDISRRQLLVLSLGVLVILATGIYRMHLGLVLFLLFEEYVGVLHLFVVQIMSLNN